MAETKQKITRIAVDICLFLTVGITWLVLYEIKPAGYNRGFYCDDRSVQLAFKGDGINLITLAVIGGVLTFVVIVLMETLISRHVHGGCNATNTAESIYNYFLMFAFGAVSDGLVEQVTKTLTGRLRPDFMDVCRPNFTLINCSIGYIEDYVCTNMELSQEDINVSRQSFPSHHTSFAVFTALFLGYYFERRVRVWYSLMLKSFLQVSLVLAAACVAVTRVTDNRHHAGDVMAGTISGFITWLWVVLTMWPQVDPVYHKKNKEMTNSRHDRKKGSYERL